MMISSIRQWQGLRVIVSVQRGLSVITFWGRLQPATIPSNLTGWFWTACDRMDCFLSPTTRMGEKAVCEWGGEVVDVGFKSTSTVSTSLAVGELLQLIVQQPSALVVTGMLATIKTLWNCGGAASTNELNSNYKSHYCSNIDIILHAGTLSFCSPSVLVLFCVCCFSS